TNLPDDDYDTVGGWLAAELGRIPRRGDSISHAGPNITVVGADARRALWPHMQLESPAESTAVPATEECANISAVPTACDTACCCWWVPFTHWRSRLIPCLPGPCPMYRSRALAIWPGIP